MTNIVLAVTGSVAAIKTLALAKELIPYANLKLVITEKAEYFLKSDYKAFQALQIPWFKDEDEWPPLKDSYIRETPILHIELRRWADCLLIAPLDANTLAKIAQGFCDNLLSSLFRAWDWSKPVVLSPAMNTLMWENNPSSQQIHLLKSWGAHIIDPIEKKLACNDIGMGGMAEPAAIAKMVTKLLERS